MNEKKISALRRCQVDKKRISSVLRDYHSNNIEEERIPFSVMDVNFSIPTIDKKAISKYQEKILGSKEWEEEALVCSDRLREWREKNIKNKISVKVPEANHKKEILEKNRAEIARGDSREKNIDYLVKYIKELLPLICVGSKKLYAFTGKIYEDISDRKLAAACFKRVLNEDINHLFKDYTEIFNQLLSDADISIAGLEQLPTNRDVIVFQNGTFNVRAMQFYADQFFEDDYIFSMLATDYDPTDFSGKEVIDNFLNTFCAGMENRKKLFCEIVGFCSSNYENKKACFYFLGAPDAGKSTVCRFIELLIGENLYMACSMKELNSKYVTGELVGIKVCADEDVATNKPLKSEDVALIKKVTSSDKIRTRQIYKSAVQIRPECKLVWAGNGMITFSTSEDLQPLINRMIIFPLEVSVPKEERDPDILSKLVTGRNYMLTLALEALHDLVENRFEFSEVVDTEDYFNSHIYMNGVEEFVETECQLELDAIAYTQELYGKYRQFCSRNFEYKALSINQFIPYLKDKYGVEKYNSGSRRGLRGIRLIKSAPNDSYIDGSY